MTISWPSWIGFRIAKNGYGETLENNRAEFQPEVGPPKRRRRTSLSQVLIDMQTVEITGQGVDDLQAFYRGTLTDGVDSFAAVHPRTGTLGIWEFVDTLKMPNAVGGGYYTVAFQLRLLSGGRYPAALKFNRPMNTGILGAL